MVVPSETNEHTRETYIHESNESETEQVASQQQPTQKLTDMFSIFSQ